MSEYKYCKLVWSDTNRKKYGIKLTEEEIFKLEKLPVSEELKSFIHENDGGYPSLNTLYNTRCSRPKFIRLLSFSNHNKVERDLDSPIISFDYIYKIVKKKSHKLGHYCVPFGISSYTPYPNNITNKDLKKMDKTQRNKFLSSFNEEENLSLFCFNGKDGNILYWKVMNDNSVLIKECAPDLTSFLSKLV